MKKVWAQFLVLLLLLFGAYSPATALVVLQYHHVSEKTPRSTSISPELFKAHLDYLEKYKFNIVDAKDLPKLFKEKKSLPNHSVIITFDDGYKSIYENAFPLLKKRKWPFTVFVNSKPHDEKNPRYMSWKQLKEMSKKGATIANHTDSHLHLIRQRKGESKSEWEERRMLDIRFAQKRIKQEIGKAYKLFAYPYGEYDMALVRQLKNEGYMAFGQQSGPLSKSSHPQILPRFPFGGGYGDMDDFALKVNSLPFPPHSSHFTKANGTMLTEPVLPADEGKPVLRLRSPSIPYLKGLSCFATGQGAIHANVEGGALVVQARKPLPVGRSRYNCTAQAGKGRYFWFSQLFIRKARNGNWYDEH